MMRQTFTLPSRLADAWSQQEINASADGLIRRPITYQILAVGIKSQAQDWPIVASKGSWRIVDCADELDLGLTTNEKVQDKQ